MEKAALTTVEEGVMTGDLLLVAEPNPANRKVNTADFIEAIASRLEKLL
jgi:isocitrate dehydrogenase